MHVLVVWWQQSWFPQQVNWSKLVGAEYLSDLGVDNVAGILLSILRLCMHAPLGCNTAHIGSGHGMVQGTIHLLLLMPTILEYCNLHISWLCIQEVRVGIDSNHMDHLMLRTLILSN